jgi:thiol-disulfide isomerase/thioredoxin
LASARFADLQGRTRALSEWQGKVVVVNFWATWCAPCLEEIPLLMTVRRAQAGRGVEVVGIAVDQVAKVGEFAANLKIDYPILLADTGGLDLIRTLGNKSAGLPFTVFLDRDGSVARTKLGFSNNPNWTRYSQR